MVRWVRAGFPFKRWLGGGHGLAPLIPERHFSKDSFGGFCKARPQNGAGIVHGPTAAAIRKGAIGGRAGGRTCAEAAREARAAKAAPGSDLVVSMRSAWRTLVRLVIFLNFAVSFLTRPNLLIFMY